MSTYIQGRLHPRIRAVIKLGERCVNNYNVIGKVFFPSVVRLADQPAGLLVVAVANYPRIVGRLEH